MIGSVGTGTPRTTIDTGWNEQGSARAALVDPSPEVSRPEPQQPVPSASGRRGRIVDTYL